MSYFTLISLRIYINLNTEYLEVIGLKNWEIIISNYNKNINIWENPKKIKITKDKDKDKKTINLECVGLQNEFLTNNKKKIQNLQKAIILMMILIKKKFRKK